MIWKDVPGWEKSYQVSDSGLVRSKARTIYAKNPDGKIGPRNYQGRKLNPGLGSNGYPLVVFTLGQERKCFTVHDLVMLTFEGPKPKGMEVLHKDGVKINNRFSNLRYGTRSENAKDKFAHGYVIPKGFNNWSSKLSRPQVRWVLNNKNKLSMRAMGRALGVGHGVISNVIKGKTYDW